jgi:hypothetical protein
MQPRIDATEQTRYFVRLNASAAAANNQDLAPLLEQFSAQTSAEGVVVYRFDSACCEFAAIAAQSSTAPRIPELGITLGVEASACLKRGREHVQFVPGTDERFANFPEGLQYGFRRLLLPLRAGETLLGLVSMGKENAEAFDLPQVSGALRLARVVAAVLERDA